MNLRMQISYKTNVAVPEPQGAASFGRSRSRNAMRLRLRGFSSDNGGKHGWEVKNNSECNSLEPIQFIFSAI
jgi:hypothetical protein